MIGRSLIISLAFIAGVVAAADRAVADCTIGKGIAAVFDQGKRIDISSLPAPDPFRRFVEGVLDEIGGPKGGDGLRFERRRLGASVNDRADSGSDENARFDSPWLSVRRSDDPCRIEATFLWDERQIVVDQALLWRVGAPPEDPRVRRPADSQDLARWIAAYEAAAFRVSAAERDMRLANLEGELPFDIFWLFSNSTQSTRGPFAGYVSDDLTNLLDRTEPAYRRLAIALFTRATSNPGEPIVIDDIRQASPFFDVRSLRVETIR